MQGCQNKPATGTFHRLFWILCWLPQMLVGKFWAWNCRNKMEIAAYFLDGTCYSKTWQPCLMWQRDAVSEFICDTLMWQHDAVSEFIWTSTWLCSRMMQFQSYPQLTLAHHRVSSSSVVEHPTRSRRVVGSNPIWDSDFFWVDLCLLEFT